MPNLLPSYRLIDTAKKEVLELKPRADLLLPYDMKKIRNGLTPDQFELKSV